MLWTSIEPIRKLINGSGKWAFTVRHLQPDSDYTIEVREVERAQRSRRRVPVSVSDVWSVESEKFAAKYVNQVVHLKSVRALNDC